MPAVAWMQERFTFTSYLVAQSHQRTGFYDRKLATKVPKALLSSTFFLHLIILKFMSFTDHLINLE